MQELLEELKIFINKELYQQEKISFSEFKLVNDILLKEQNEHSKNKK